MRNRTPTVLIVDDEIDMRLLVRVVLDSARHGIEVVGEAADGIDAMSAFSALTPPQVPDVVILDNRMPGRSGIDVAAEMLKIAPQQHIILFSAYLSPELELQARVIGIDRCVSKNDVDQLPELVLAMARLAE